MHVNSPSSKEDKGRRDGRVEPTRVRGEQKWEIAGEFVSGESSGTIGSKQPSTPLVGWLAALSGAWLIGWFFFFLLRRMRKNNA